MRVFSQGPTGTTYNRPQQSAYAQPERPPQPRPQSGSGWGQPVTTTWAFFYLAGGQLIATMKDSLTFTGACSYDERRMHNS